MKDLQDWAAVHKLLKQNKNVTEISKLLNMSRTTVYKLINTKEEPIYNRTKYPSKVSKFKEDIFNWRTNPEYDYNGTRIYRELKKKGYQGSISPIYTFLKKVDEKADVISKKATVRIETPIGDQAQFDWSEYQVWVDGRKQTVYCFAIILAACRKKAVCYSLKSDANAIYEAIQELFEELGGVTLELVIDNPKALVIENNPKNEDEIEYNPKALMLASHLGTELNACNCYWPKTKGKIEKPFNYIEEQFVKGNQFKNMADLNRKGKEFVNEWCNEVHTTTKRIPNEFYEKEEKKALLPLPTKRLDFNHQLKERIVSFDSYISINTNKYSLPVKYVGKTVLFRIVYGYLIEVYTKEKEYIITIDVKFERNSVFSNDEHYEDIRVVPKSIPQIRRDFTAIFKNGDKYLLQAGMKFDQPTHHARQILKLLDLYNAEDIDKILAYGLEHNILDIKSIKELIKEKGYEIIFASGKPILTNVIKANEDELTRDCKYYEINQGSEKQ